MHGGGVMDVNNHLQSVPASTGFELSKNFEEQDLNSQPSGRVTAPVSDTISLTSDNILIARQVITQQISIALQLDTSSTTDTGVNNSHEQHRKHLVNNVLDKIHQHNDSHHIKRDEHHLSDNARSVRSKVEHGFQQARSILNRIAVMSDSIAREVDQTESQLMRVIDQIENTFSNADVMNNMTAVTDSSLLNSTSVAREVNTSLQLTTQQGDVVTIHFNKSQSLTTGSFEGSGGYLMYADSMSESLLSISIEGDLSDREYNAILKVVKKVGQLADSLFNGESVDAIGKLSDLNINSRQLSSLTLDMSSQFSSSAVTAYNEVSNMVVTPIKEPILTTVDNMLPVVDMREDASQGTSDVIAAPLTSDYVPAEPASRPVLAASQVVVAMLNDISNVVAQLNSSNSFENPFKEARKIFDHMADLYTLDRQDITDNSKEFIKELFSNMLERFDSHAKDDFFKA